MKGPHFLVTNRSSSSQTKVETRKPTKIHSKTKILLGLLIIAFLPLSQSAPTNNLQFNELGGSQEQSPQVSSFRNQFNKQYDLQKKRLQRKRKKQQKEKTSQKKKRSRKESKKHLDFSTTRIPQGSPFTQFEKDPELATLLWHSNSAAQKFSKLDDLDKLDTASPEYAKLMTELIEEVHKENVTYQEKHDLIDEYYREMGRGGYGNSNPDAKLLTCSSCGMRDYDISSKKGNAFVNVNLHKDLEADSRSILELTPEQCDEFEMEKALDPLPIPINEAGQQGTIKVHKLRSIHESFHRDVVSYWHLHPEFVTTNEDGTSSTSLCACCHRHIIQDKKKPPNSLADGLDMGDYKRLSAISEPNALELALLAQVRHYHTVVKIQPNGGASYRVDRTGSKIRSNSILFPHDSPQQSCLALLLKLSEVDVETIEKAVADRITIQFVGPENQIDTLIQKTRGTSLISARPHVIYQWILLLKSVNPLYFDMPEVPSYKKVKETIDAANEALYRFSEKVSDKETILREAILGDDIAGVRTTTDQSEHGEAPDDQHDAQAYCAVCPSDPKSNRDKGLEGDTLDSIHVLESAADAIGLDVNENLNKWYKSAREKLPLNEYSDPEHCLTKAFPHVFLYGRSYYRPFENVTSDDSTPRRRPNMGSKAYQHLLYQYTGVPSTCRELLFYLYDQQRRRSVVQKMAAKIRGNPSSFAKFETMLNSKEFHRDLKYAIENPTSKCAKKIISDILPILTFAGKQNFGALEINNSIAQALALTQRHGCAGLFITISPNDVSLPSSFRLTFRSFDNTSFPAVVDSSFTEAMKNEAAYLGSGNISIPTDYQTKSANAIRNPVAVVREYRRVIDCVMKILVGIDPSKSHKRSIDIANHGRKGAFGKIYAMHGVHECQARGSLHTHFLLFGGLTPKLLQGAVTCEKLCKAVSEALDTMITASLPRSLHVKDIIRDDMAKCNAPLIEKRTIGPAIVPQPITSDGGQSWNQCAHENCKATGIHRHCFTCHKPSSGSHGCRLAKPSGLSNGTAPCQLLEHEDQENLTKDHPSVDFTYKFNGEEICCYKTHQIQPKEESDSVQAPAPSPDTRILVWELHRPELPPLPPIDESLIEEDKEEAKSQAIENVQEALGSSEHNSAEVIANIVAWMTETLTADQVLALHKKICNDLPKRNGLVTEYNDVLINATGSSVNTSLLGNTTQSKAALFYIGKFYLCMLSTKCSFQKTNSDLAPAPYLGKEKTKPQQALTALNLASKQIRKYPSTAEDTGTDKRTAQHLLTRTVNTLNRQMEVTDTQAIMALLGESAIMNSHDFVYYGASDAVKFITKEAYKGALHLDDVDLHEDNQTEDYEDSSDDDDSFISNSDDQEHEEVLLAENDTEEEPECLSKFMEDTGLSERDLHVEAPRAHIYTIPDKNGECAKKIPVTLQLHYRYRGFALRMLNRTEFYALIGIRQKTSTKHHNSKSYERPQNASYSFAREHPLHATHEMYIKSKQPVVIYSCRPPPYPGKEPETRGSPEHKTWQKKANRFALYFLAAFRPEDSLYDGTNNAFPSYNWDEFCDWVEAQEQSSTLISRYRLTSLWTTVFGTYSRNRDRTIMSQFRMRNRTIWSEEQKTEAKEYFDSTNRSGGNGYQQDDLIYKELFETSERDNALSSSQLDQCKKDSKYAYELAHTLTSMFQMTTNAQDSPTINRPPIDSQHLHFAKKKIQAIKNITTEDVMKKMSASETVQQDAHGHQVTTLTKEQQVDQTLDSLSLSEQQRTILDKVKDYLIQLGPRQSRSPSPPKPLKMMVTGMPGTGKSYIIHAINQIADILQSGYIQRLAHTGIAAVLIDGATLCSVLSIDSRKGAQEPLSHSALVKLRKRLHSEELSLIIIDEISNLDGKLLFAVHRRLQELTGNFEEPYGGIGLVMFGDFSQLPPVRSTSLPYTALQVAALFEQEKNRKPTPGNTKRAPRKKPYKKSSSSLQQRLKSIKATEAKQRTTKNLSQYGEYTAGSAKRIAGELFMEFEVYQLTEQQRAKDEEHMKRLTKMSEGKSLTTQDLSLYKTLSKADLDPANDTSDKTPWRYVPVLVSTNRERIDIASYKSKLYAREHSTHVFRWKNDIKTWKNRPILLQERLAVQDSDPCFFQQFVAGADVFLNTNLNNALSLANGTPLKLHSFTLSSQEQLELIHSQIETVPIGGTITLEEPPASVNVLVPNDDYDQLTAKQKAQRDILKSISISKEDIVIPLTPMRGQTKPHNYTVSQPHSGLARISTQELFPFDLSFASTAHKSQGRTLPRVVIALSSRYTQQSQMSFASVYVSLSRTRCAEDIRILVHDVGPRPGKLGLEYITRLKHDIHVVRYYHGFIHPIEGQKWDSTRALSFKENRKQ